LQIAHYIASNSLIYIQTKHVAVDAIMTLSAAGSYWGKEMAAVAGGVTITTGDTGMNRGNAENNSG